MMFHQENFSVIINTGSKQGITNPQSIGACSFPHLLRAGIDMNRGDPAYKPAYMIQCIQGGHQEPDREPVSRTALCHQANVTAHLFMCGAALSRSGIIISLLRTKPRMDVDRYDRRGRKAGREACRCVDGNGDSGVHTRASAVCGFLHPRAG